jgi:hypothetical protein
MIELLTRNPDAALHALKESGGVCEGASQIPSSAPCPQEQYCTLPGGVEVCVYGFGQMSQMQLTREEIAHVVAQPAPEVRGISEMEILAVASVFIAGIVVGRNWHKARQRDAAGDGGTK